MDSADSRLLLSFQRSFSLETPQLNLPSRVIRAAPGHVIGDRDGRAGAQPAPLGDPRHAGRFFFFSGLMVTNLHSSLMDSGDPTFQLETPQPRTLNLPFRVIQAAPGHVTGDHDRHAGVTRRSSACRQIFFFQV